MERRVQIPQMRERAEDVERRRAGIARGRSRFALGGGELCVGQRQDAGWGRCILKI